MKNETKGTDNGGAGNNTAGPAPRRPGKAQREARLEIPPGEADLAALRSVMREWLVPRLVEDFLRERGIELKYSRGRIPNSFKV